MQQYVSRHVFLVSVFSAVLAGAVTATVVTLVRPYVSDALPAAVHGPSASEFVISQNEEQEVVRVVKRVSPAVVAVNVTRAVPVPRGNASSTVQAPASPLLPLPGGRRLGAGSGFFVSADGLIVTNRHVVDNVNAEYVVTLQDGKRVPAKVLGVDPSLDLAILKVEMTNAPSLELGDSDTLEVGQTVLAIGNALAQFQNSLTKGVISGKNRRLIADGVGGAEILEEAIQTDAAINPGNSGGPLLNLRGQVIGVTTAVSEGGQSLGFAIPVNAVKQAVESVKRTGRIIRPWLGVRYFMIDEELSRRDRLPVSAGALISRGASPRDLAIVPGSPADKAGMKENDIIIEIGGKALSDDRSLATALSRFAPGDEVQVKVLRQGEEKTLTLKLDERAPEDR